VLLQLEESEKALTGFDKWQQSAVVGESKLSSEELASERNLGALTVRVEASDQSNRVGQACCMLRSPLKLQYQRFNLKNYFQYNNNYETDFGRKQEDLFGDVPGLAPGRFVREHLLRPSVVL
jgi:hypothetical protein